MKVSVLPAWTEQIGHRTHPGPAIYIGPSDVDPSTPDEVGLLLESDDGSGCPGVMGVVLGIGGDRVWERRYHQVESVRSCFDTDTLQPGWWEGIEIPDLVAQTGTMTWPDQGVSVDVYNGTPEMDEFLRWGLERFTLAGLDVPEVDSVTFLEQESTCRGFFGFAETEETGPAIVLCYRPDQICDDEDCSTRTYLTRRALLHEHAHIWIAQNVDQATRRQFMQLVGVSRWRDDTDPWEQRGTELAANTIMYGLMDEVRVLRLQPEFALTCAQYEKGFRLLTGAGPIGGCPH